MTARSDGSTSPCATTTALMAKIKAAPERRSQGVPLVSTPYADITQIRFWGLRLSALSAPLSSGAPPSYSVVCLSILCRSPATTEPQPSERPPVADRGLPVAQALWREVRMPTTISAGDTAWLLMSAALVMLMTPALGFFYGGLVRRKNVLATIMHSFFILALISVQWVLWGYTLAFGPDHGGLIGGLDWLALRGVGQDPGPYAPTVPHEAYMVFQMMFAVITPALITGAFAERKRFKAFVIFTLPWATFVYDPV